ncbi:MAG TPA: NAD(P)/FAD-dependent oxidoreductase [Methanomassiliicoccales archaeon]|jgi:thioredoxin reductase (NADPH)
MDYDLVIIGGGPAGLTAGICAVQSRMRTVIIDAAEAGGQPGMLYPEKEIHNFPTTQVVTGKDISKSFVEHALNKGCSINENEIVQEIIDVPDGFRVVTSKGSYTATAVIVAIGNGFFIPKKLDIPGAEEFEGRGVHYMMPPKEGFAGKRVMFVGGGNSALEMALMVCEIADICIVHRRGTFRADHCFIERVEESEIRTYMNAQVLRIEGDGKVEKVVLKVGDAEEEVPVDMVVIKVGMTPEPENLRRWNLDLEGEGIRVSQQMMTSRKGVFAAGDAVAYPGKYRQIVTSCSEGATAANSVIKYVKKLPN